MKQLIALLSGLLFGAGMVVSQMVDPQKVTGFLDLFGAWDPQLAFVMAGAIATFMPIYHWLIKPRSHALLGDEMPQFSQGKVTPSLLVGSALFGLGWGMLGICPGPAVTAFSFHSPVLYLFVVGMIAAMWLPSAWFQKRRCPMKS
ncbi:hypothetical protein VST7929_02765 [Vibrio stylophorae]|uniref:YeeE/YedE family protein n=1 Tax=Vibrio stylophorae TaxID=659351 RepID=A0ABM8ZWU7_9VIBR|nr:DUF6691 family protein [Vibrio stylophorae]CAH0535104.1 hypothetical protein VST7929_02765 [Vibrio stylophorae]